MVAKHGMLTPMLSRRGFIASLPALGAAAAAPSDPEWLSIAAAAESIRRGQISPVELTRRCLTRIDQLNPKLNAFITVMRNEALAQAQALEGEQKAGRLRSPLHGIPIALKDLYDTAGVRTTAASKHYADRVPAADAEVVRLLKAAGAVIVGKTNMDEFAYNFTAETSAHGLARNPWDPKRTPGGSSGGSAVAVAAAMCFGALGSDTGGSIRLPASFCGITGFKPAYGRIPAGGVVPLAWSLDHVGPMCRSAQDAALMLHAMAPRPGDRNVTADYLKSIRIGVPRAVFFDALDAEVADLIERAIKTLDGMTNGTREVKLPELAVASEVPPLPETYSRVIVAEAYAFHENIFKAHPERYHAGTRKSVESGAGVSMPVYARAREHMDRLRAGSNRLFGQAEILVTPTAPAPAFEFGTPAGLVYLRNTAPWNLYGLPTISIPCGLTKAGLPVGMQLTAAADRDDLVLGMALRYQQETDWHLRRPPGV
jgi:aspartyl-tRNA(Asn)/glutamyl-tRNA(Gln) amidotransferase subunit A